MRFRPPVVFVFAALLIVVAVPRAQQPSSPVIGGAASAGALAATLAPTNHPRLPLELSLLWLAPTPSTTTGVTRSQSALATAANLIAKAQYSQALPILAQPSLDEGLLAPYATYLEAVAQLALGRLSEARQSYRAVQNLAPVGYLSEAAAIGEAEANEKLDDEAAALAIYERLARSKTTDPDDILMRVGRTAKATGNLQRAAEVFSRVYYEFPLGELAPVAGDELKRWLPNVPAIASGSERYRLELGRAERLFAARRYPEARTSFQAVRAVATDEDRPLVQLRLAECDYYQKRYRAARDGVRPFLERGPRQAEALYFHALASRELGDRATYLKTARRVIDEFGDQGVADAALDHLGTHFIRADDDVAADATFRELYAKYPKSRYSERAAWKIGWASYRAGRFADAAVVFERAASDFPRSDYRPPWLYWSGRSREQLREKAMADERYLLAATDYLNSYYGRLAVERLGGRRPASRVIQRDAVDVVDTSSRGANVPGIPSEAVVRALLELELFDLALGELRYAQRVWGDSSALQATVAWVHRRQGERAATGSERFTLYRSAVNTMRRAYPQFMAAGGEDLPPDVLRVIFPLEYWDLLQEQAAARSLDPYLVAALVAQESTFVPDIRSSARAVGLMQLVPLTARAMARRLKLPYSPRLMANPEANVKMGTTYLADKLKEFGDLHLALASYNAGERVVRRWMAERPGVPRDEFIDDIPYPETQNYVKRIIGTAEDYRRLYAATWTPGAARAAASPARAGVASKPTPSPVRPSPTTKRPTAGSTRKG